MAILAKGALPTRALILVALLTAAPLASAGSEEEPTVADEQGDTADTAADIVRAWLAYEDDGVRVAIQTLDGSRPASFPGYVYWVQFRTGGVTSAAWLGFDSRARYHTHIGPLDSPDYDGDIGTFANEGLKDPTQDRGRPSTWTGLLPWNSVPGLRPGATLVDITFGSARYDPRTERWDGGLDIASTPLAFRAVEELGFFDRPLVLLPTLALAAGVGAFGGWQVRRRLRARG